MEFNREFWCSRKNFVFIKEGGIKDQKVKITIPKSAGGSSQAIAYCVHI